MKCHAFLQIWHFHTVSCFSRLPGFSGVNCEISDETMTTIEPISVTVTTAVPPTTAVPCQDTDSCEGHYTCNGEQRVCRTGYTGEDCKTRNFTGLVGDDPQCPSIGSCKGNGDCFNKSCCCYPGFTTEFCATEVIECDSNPCQNGGFCKDHVNGYNCSCVSGKGFGRDLLTYWHAVCCGILRLTF